MSTSRLDGDAVRGGVDGQAGQLLLDDAPAPARRPWPRRPARSGTSAAMTSSRRTIRKSTWTTVCRTGCRCSERARARWVSEPTCQRQQLVETGVARQGVAQVPGIDGHGGPGSSVPVDHRGDPARGAEAPRRRGPGRATGLCNQGDLSHRHALPATRGPRESSGAGQVWSAEGDRWGAGGAGRVSGGDGAAGRRGDGEAGRRGGRATGRRGGGAAGAVPVAGGRVFRPAGWIGSLGVRAARSGGLVEAWSGCGRDLPSGCICSRDVRSGSAVGARRRGPNGSSTTT